MTPKPFKQSDLSFAVGPKFQTVWGLREAIVFALEGVGVTAFLLFAYAENIIGMICSTAAVAVAVVLLLSHLGQPLVAWRAIANVRGSWISRGTVAIGLFVAVGTVYVVGLTIPSAAFLQRFEIVFLSVLVLGAAFILFYPGLAMRASAGIAFWRSPFLPALSFLHGLTSGAVLVTSAISAVSASVPTSLALGCVGLIVVTTLATLSFLIVIRQRSKAAALSASTLIQQEPLLFWTVAIGIGLALPLAALILTTNAWALIVIAVGRLLGDTAFRYAILKAGAFESAL